jgi:hypothetical protein
MLKAPEKTIKSLVDRLFEVGVYTPQVSDRLRGGTKKSVLPLRVFIPPCGVVLIYDAIIVGL